MLFSNIKASWLRKVMLSLLALLITLPTFAQNGEAASSSSNLEVLLIVVLSFVLIVAVLILIIGLYLVNIIKMIILEDKKQKAAEEGVEYVEEEKKPWWNKLVKKASDAVPVEKEETILLDHNYDGIHELDNHLPPWWKWLFYITIIWGVVYLVVYHVFDALPLMEEEYEIAMEDARLAKEARMSLAGNNIDENNVEFTDSDQALANGEAIFERECVACHAAEGQGLIGPNLTDNYWIHGGSMKDIFSTVKYGVPQKGMISWQSKLTPTDMRDVSSYIMTLVGTNPQGPPPPKAPEGELYEPETEESTDTDQASEQPEEQPAEI
jgi:cytochrome c oxidase cbb3-type subunit 3